MQREPAGEREALERAARLYQDDLLPDLYDDWLRPKREQLRLQFAEILSRLTACAEKEGDFPAGIRHAARLLALDPLREGSAKSSSGCTCATMIGRARSVYITNV